MIASIRPKLLLRAGAGAALFLFVTCPVSAAPAGGQVLFESAFSGSLGDGWSFEREDRANWRVGPFGLEVRVQPGNMWGGANNARNVLVHSIPAPEIHPVEISVTLSNQPTAQWEQSDLVWFYDDSNMVKLGQELVTGRLSIVMGREEADRARTIAIVPLDAYRVELRLQALRDRVRGQFRTAPWRSWRDVGECTLPRNGEPKASLQFYNGPAKEDHWVLVSKFTVRQLAGDMSDPGRAVVQEAVSRSSDPSRPKQSALALGNGYRLLSDLGVLANEPKASYEQKIHVERSGAYGWNWDRRTPANTNWAFAGVGLGSYEVGTEEPGEFFKPMQIGALRSFELEVDAVTWLENDHGDHNLVLMLPLKPAGRIAIWFDWYGPSSDASTLTDGYREYGYFPTPGQPDTVQYRIRGFRGAPPRINVKPFLDDAARRGVAAETQAVGVWFGNQVGDGSRGGTRVTKLDFVINGVRFTSAEPAPAGVE